MNKKIVLSFLLVFLISFSLNIFESSAIGLNDDKDDKIDKGDWIIYGFGETKCIGVKCGFFGRKNTLVQKTHFKRKYKTPEGKVKIEYDNWEIKKGCCE